MAWNSTTLTDSGVTLLSELINGGKLTITRAVLGAGTASADELPKLTELVEPIDAPATIAGSTETADKCGRNILIRIRNTNVAESVRMKQVGIYAKTDSSDEVLLAVMQDEIGETIQSYSDFPDFLLEFNAAIAVARTNNISVMIDSHTNATMDDLNKHDSDENAHAELFAKLKRKVIATRPRSSDKPDYSEGGGGEQTEVTLETAAYSGTAEVTVIVNDTEYDGINITRQAENAADGTIIITEE
jgi:hypothetical protein